MHEVIAATPKRPFKGKAHQQMGPGRWKPFLIKHLEDTTGGGVLSHLALAAAVE